MSRFLLPLALSACVSAGVLPHPPMAPAVGVDSAVKHISFPIVERRAIPALQRRDNVVTATNHSNIAYMVQLDIGSPAQSVKVQIDTGSNELWVNPDCSTVKDSGNKAFCKTLGHYDPDSSSSSVDLAVTGSLAYGKGTVELTYYEDDISVPGSNNSKLSEVVFGVATSSEDAAVPILGVGFGNGKNLQYDNFIDALAAQNVTNGRAFSLVLGTGADSDSTPDPVGENVENGAIIFGGVDTKKFSGPLTQFANLAPQGNEEIWRYWVQLDSIGYTPAGKTGVTAISGSSMPIVLDSGSSLNYLPTAVMNGLATAFGVKESTAEGYLLVDCAYGTKGGSLSFVFGSLTIDVPYSDIIWEADTNTCIVGALPVSGDVTALLGDTFLRSAYVVFDQDHEHIYLAPAANCGTHEQSLPADGNYAFTGECTAAASTSAAAGALTPVSATALLAFVGIQAVIALL